MTLDDRLEQIVRLLGLLVAKEGDRGWYSTDEFAGLVGRRPLTVREWCRQGRIAAEKKQSGRGAHTAWVISHAELERFQREGLRRDPGCVRSTPK